MLVCVVAVAMRKYHANFFLIDGDPSVVDWDSEPQSGVHAILSSTLEAYERRPVWVPGRPAGIAQNQGIGQADWEDV